MRFKVGDTWYEALPGQPIMLEMTPKDRENIANMAPEATRYALFDPHDERTVEEMFVWMEKPMPGDLHDGKMAIEVRPK